MSKKEFSKKRGFDVKKEVLGVKKRGFSKK